MTIPHMNIPRETIAQFCIKWKIREFAFFGSVLRDDFRSDSDIVRQTIRSDLPLLVNSMGIYLEPIRKEIFEIVQTSQ